MASPATGGSATTRSADSYLGHYLSVVSKSEMRYEGVLYYLNPQDATFGLQNVRSLGTEGRRKDGPQVLPDDRVFDYIQFRGSDTKDLKVLDSPTPRETSSVLDDPAIIRTHYIPPAPMPTSAAPYAVSQGIADRTSVGGLQNYPPVRNLASIGALLPPPSSHVNSSAMLPHLPGFSAPSPLTVNPYMQQESLIGQAQGSAALYPIKQQIQYPAFSPSFGSSTSNMHQPSQSLMMPFTLGSLTSTANVITSSASAFPSNSPSLSSLVPPNVVPNSQQFLLPTTASSAIVPSVSPLTAKLFERSSSIPQAVDQPNLVLASNSPNMPSAGGPSTISNTEEPKSSTAVTGQVLQTGPAKCSFSRPSESVCEDVEVVKVLTSESRSLSSKDAEAPILPLPKAFTEKDKDSNKLPSSNKPYQQRRGDMNGGANAPSYDYVKANSRQTGKKIDVISTQAHQISNGSSEERGEKKVGTDPETRESIKGSSREGGKRMNTRLPNHKNGEHYAQQRGNRVNRGPSRANSGGNGRGRGREATGVRRSFKFSEDFDFEAMNEKFNKDDLWGDLGKSREDQQQGKEYTGKNDIAGSVHGEAAENIDTKPAYDKDEFFDSFSSGQAYRRKLSERRNMDRETFINLKIVRENRRTETVGRGSQHNGPNDGRGHGNAGRGRGKVQPVWTRVT